MKSEVDLFAESTPERRAILKKRGYKPSVAMTVLTKIPHWTSPDGTMTFTEVSAWLRETREAVGK